MIRVACSGCGQKLKVHEIKAGTDIACPRCEKIIAVPEESAPETPPKKRAYGLSWARIVATFFGGAAFLIGLALAAGGPNTISGLLLMILGSLWVATCFVAEHLARIRHVLQGGDFDED